MAFLDKSILQSYFKLMRLDSCLSVLWCYLFPGLSGIALATNNVQQIIYYTILFLIGAFLMRPVGCTISDIFDRKIDAEVERTQDRPLAKGILSVKQALILLILLTPLAFVILLLTNKTTIILGIICMPMVIVYPLLKRYFWWPQFFLGLTINFGALMGWSVIRDNLSLQSVLLYIGCIFWTLGYDTIYAHQDKEDDVKIGIKSTAIYFGDKTKLWLKRFYLMSLTMWASMALISRLNIFFYITLLAVSLVFYYQYKKSNFDNPINCSHMFKINSYIGLLLYVGIFLGNIFSRV
ncbi:MAG: 4-hydroxybenzoate octaprenyltransferase [Wolbachia endosymbiont of Xenopsylla cheopis]